MKQLTAFENLCFRVGAIMMLLGVAGILLYPFACMCVYGIGTLLFTLMQLRAEYEGRDFAVRRLRRQQLLGCCCFVIALVLMSMQLHNWGPCRRNEWIVALTIGCVFELYTAFRLPQALGKDE